MRQIKEYDQINEAGEIRRLPAGIYGVRITDVVDHPDDEYLEVFCEITKGEYANYFKTCVEAGLPDGSRHFRSYKTKALPFFKAFITAVEKSNPGFKWDWDEKKLIGKGVIAVFGEEEYLDKENNVRVGTHLVEFRSIDAYKEGKIKVPELKRLSGNDAKTAAPAAGDPTAVIDDDLPF